MPGYSCAGGSPTSQDVCISGCGDGVKAAEEECDDGNYDSSDGCSPTCKLEPGWTCETNVQGAATDDCDVVCGDGIKAGPEQCDSGDSNGNNQGCTSNCLMQPSAVCEENEDGLSLCRLCGNGYREKGEVCDDGSTSGEGGCSADCLVVTLGWLCDGGTPATADDCVAGPSVPFAPVVGQRTVNSIEWTWTEVDSRGLPILRYEFEWTAAHPVNGTSTHTRLVLDKTEMDVRDLPQDVNTRYTARVSACTSAGCSTMSATSDPAFVRPSAEAGLLDLAQIIVDAHESAPEPCESDLDEQAQPPPSPPSDIHNGDMILADENLGLGAELSGENADLSITDTYSEEASETADLPPPPCSMYKGTPEEGLVPCTPDDLQPTPAPVATEIPMTTPCGSPRTSVTEGIALIAFPPPFLSLFMVFFAF